MVGYAIIDTGAAKSMIGLELATCIQDIIMQETGEDLVEMDCAKTTKFTHAGGGKGESIGRFGFERPVALVEENNKLWFDLVQSRSPLLLGLDYLEKSGADLIKDKLALVYPDGHEEPVAKLSSTHCALPTERGGPV